MTEKSVSSLKLAIVITIIILTLLIYLPAPAFSQQAAPERVQSLLVNGGFEGGFQEKFGIGYGWGGFSNGNAVVGWNYDDWSPVVMQGQYSQRIEIKEALEPDRYAGIYQTVSVVPGSQYKLTIKGLIRSEEGSIELSDYGYRLQYAVDYEGATAWELLPADAWQELPWDEQPMSEVDPGYEYNTFETTVTAQSDQLTIFIRGWKKWVNDGVGMFNLDEIDFVGAPPSGFQAPEAAQNNAVEVVAVSAAEVEEPVAAESAEASDDATAEEMVAETVEVEIEGQAEAEVVEAETEPVADSESFDRAEAVASDEALLNEASNEASNEVSSEADTALESSGLALETESADDATMTSVESDDQTTEAESVAPVEESTSLDLSSAPTTSVEPDAAPELEVAPLPVSGFGDESIMYIITASIVLLLVMFVGAITATMRRQIQ